MLIKQNGVGKKGKKDRRKKGNIKKKKWKMKIS